MYPKLLPHQLRTFSSYPNPPICHLGESKHSVFCDLFIVLFYVFSKLPVWCQWYDRTPACEAMYLAELREFRTFLQENTDMDELKNLNLLGVQFALHRVVPERRSR